VNQWSTLKTHWFVCFIISPGPKFPGDKKEVGWCRKERTGRLVQLLLQISTREEGYPAQFAMETVLL
jgi:hypothetical protein